MRIQCKIMYAFATTVALVAAVTSAAEGNWALLAAAACALATVQLTHRSQP